jgi:hypothetical protein
MHPLYYIPVLPIVNNTVPQTKFSRRRGPTPEQLRSEDEREFEKAERKDEKQAEKAVCLSSGNREKQEGEVAEGADSTARPSSKGPPISSLVPSPVKQKSKRIRAYLSRKD